jgi:hypothetical protein
MSPNTRVTACRRARSSSTPRWYAATRSYSPSRKSRIVNERISAACRRSAIRFDRIHLRRSAPISVSSVT